VVHLREKSNALVAVEVVVAKKLAAVVLHLTLLGINLMNIVEHSY
jgi:hypothetical protein